MYEQVAVIATIRSSVHGSTLALATATDFRAVKLPVEGGAKRFLHLKLLDRMGVIPQRISPGLVHVHVTDYRQHYFRVAFACETPMDME